MLYFIPCPEWHGERFKLENLPSKVVTFADDPAWDFQKVNAERRAKDPMMGKNWGVRRDADKKELKTLTQLVEAKAISMVVLHTDLLPAANACFATLIGRSLSTHFMIDWDGTIYQGLDVRLTALHAMAANSTSIGIDLNNEMPNLLEPDQARQFKGYDKQHAAQGEQFLRFESQTMRLNGFKVRSYGYTDAQYQALIELLKVLTQQLKIPAQVPVDDAGAVIPSMLENPAFEGIVAHWHLKASRWDPGPGFDWERMLLGLSGQYNSFPVLLAGMKNISALITPKKITQAAQALYRNTETRARGTYPVGRFQNWNGGVRLYLKEGSDVHAMVDGKLAAAHISTEETALGSNGFVLLRHDIAFPSREEEEPKVLKVYSLYMHLAPMSADDPDAPEWLKRLRGEKVEGGVEAATPKHRKEDDRDNEDDEDEEIDEEEIRMGGDRGSLLTVASGLRALREGRIALFPVEEPGAILVRSGQVIGRVGGFGPEEEREGAVHVEVFSDDTWRHAVDMSVHRRHFTRFAEDVGRSLTVRSPEVLTVLSRGMFDPARRGSRANRISPDDIEDFFMEPGNAAGRRLFRRAITRHVSQWSDQVDWFQALVVDPETGEPPKDWAEARRRLAGLTKGKNAALNARSAASRASRSMRW